MKSILLAINVIVLFCAVDLVLSQRPGGTTPRGGGGGGGGGGPTTQAPFSTRKWFVKPYRGGYAKGNIVAADNQNRNVEGNVDKQSRQGKLSVQGRGDYNFGQERGKEAVEVKNAKGITAEADQSKKNPNNGVRTADAGKWHGELKNKKTGNDQEWDPALQGGPKIDTVMRGKGDSFDAAGSRGNKYNVDPDPGQTKQGGKGVITRNGEKYNYQNSRASNGDASAQMTNVGTGPNRRTYTCQGQKIGVSNCVDQNGLKYGEVVEQPDGTVIVKKTIAKGVDVPVAKAKVIKNQNGRSVATVNDGLFQGQAGNYKERDCMADYGKSGGSKIKIERPLRVNYNSESRDGRRVFQFPDCVTMGAKITLPPGVDVNRIALQFDVNILPAGKLKCVDPGACNKDCYYCNFCNNSRKVDILSNGNGDRQMCNIKGGGTYDMSMTACPPPEAFNKAMCSGFTKSDPTYFKKKGDLQTRLLVWLRPANDQQLRDQYYNTVNGNSIAKQLLRTQYAIDNKNFINANNPTDFDLAEYYIKKNAKPAEELVGCIEGTTNYTVSGQKVRTDFLLEAGSLAAAPKSLFDNKQCPEVDKINQAQAQADAQAAASRAPPRSGWGNFGNFFGRG